MYPARLIHLVEHSLDEVVVWDVSVGVTSHSLPCKITVSNVLWPKKVISSPCENVLRGSHTVCSGHQDLAYHNTGLNCVMKGFLFIQPWQAFLAYGKAVFECRKALSYRGDDMLELLSLVVQAVRGHLSHWLKGHFLLAKAFGHFGI